MNISWYGQSCFRIQSKDIVLVTDPFDKKIGLRPPYGTADLVTISHDHFDHNNSDALKGDPFIVDCAGEYEIKKIILRGINSFHDNKEGAERGNNVIYRIEMEDIILCHLGDFGQNAFTNGQLEKIGGVDILLIPIGGISTIDWKIAVEIINQIEPNIIIPMHYKVKGLISDLLKMDSAESFCKEFGVSEKDTIEKFSIKKKDIVKDSSKVVTMKVL